MIDLYNSKTISIDLFKDLDPDIDKVLYKGKFVPYLGCFKNIENVPIREGIYLYFLKKQIGINSNVILNEETIFGVAYRNPSKIEKIFTNSETTDKSSYIFERMSIKSGDNLLMTKIKDRINELKISKEEIKDLFRENNYKESDVQNILRKIIIGGELTFKKFEEIISILPNSKIELKIKDDKS